jgi:hypothetical protein
MVIGEFFTKFLHPFWVKADKVYLMQSVKG